MMSLRPMPTVSAIRLVIVALILCLVALNGLRASLANASQSIESQDNICAEATREQERAWGIPADLLGAIALAESGRWDPQKKASIAWPWTVTSGGDGTFFPTKQDAIRHVRKLQSQGVTNIDVGCMQINLYYHGDAFASLHQAFDPRLNTTYAADFLSRLFDESKSWTRAVGHYHSRTAERSTYYRNKVLALWRKTPATGTSDAVPEERQPQSQSADTGDDGGLPGYTMPTPLWTKAMVDRLNQRFRARSAVPPPPTSSTQFIAGGAVHGSAAEPSNEATFSRQLAQWRQLRGNANSVSVMAARNRAETLRQDRQRWGSVFASNANQTPNSVGFRDVQQQEDFAAKRTEQLQKWRRTNGG